MESRPSVMSYRGATSLLLGLAAFGACDGTSHRRERANVILIVIDDLRADHLTPFGYSRDTSPFLDELAATGVLFENTVSQSSGTKTSVASLLTSLYPEAHGVRGEKEVLQDSIQVLPEVLKDSGYRTFAIHGNPWLEERFGFNQGFDEFLFTHWYKDTFDAQKVNDQALQWLEEKSAEPFFLYLHYMDVHSPWKPPGDFDRFGPEAADKYDGSILYLDSKLKGLHGELTRRGLDENTWIIVTSDHGEEFGEHGNYKVGHGLTLYREVLRVPLIFRHPDALSGRRVSRQVRLIDVAPTILDLLEIPIPEDMDGVSLRANVVDAGDYSGDDLEAFSQAGLNGVAKDKDLLAVTTKEFKYILDFASGIEELYDLTVDPGETRNVAAVNPGVVREFNEKALRFRRIEAAKRIGVIPGTEIDEELREQLRSLGYLK
jgi:arylsulfatase A-like enzyme